MCQNDNLMAFRWDELQATVSSCRRCETDLPYIEVECPPGRLYLEGIKPPNTVKVLFIGVAPPKMGNSFHTDSSDNLWLGLSTLLRELRRPCATLYEFYNRGFFLIHSAKCAIRGTTSPHLNVAQLCASIHLTKEIDCLAPEAVCWLSKNICFPVSQMEAKRRGLTHGLKFGVPTSISVDNKTVPFLPTTWPGRAWKEITKAHLKSFFSMLRIPEWEDHSQPN